MALAKRGKTWHCHFVVNGQRVRQSLGTRDWREAQAKEKQLIAEASEGKLTHNSGTLARQPFGQAADDYVRARKLELANASQAKEKQLLVQLRAYFKTRTAEGDHSEANHRIPDLESRSEGRPRDTECRAWHFASHHEAGKALGTCCRRYTPAEGAEHDWAGTYRGRKAATP